VKVIFELKKSLDKIAGGRAVGGGSTMASPMPPGMGPQATHVTATTLPGPGQPPSIISAAAAFSTPGELPRPDPSLLPKQSSSSVCNSCGYALKVNAKFCSKCGNKIS
jgi:hypothetical protein